MGDLKTQRAAFTVCFSGRDFHHRIMSGLNADALRAQGAQQLCLELLTLLESFPAY